MSAWETERRKHRRSFTTEMRPNISVSPILSIPFCVCRYLSHTISTYMWSCMYGCNEQQTVRCNLLADNINNGQNRPTNAYALARCSTMFMCAWNVCSVHQYTICDSALMQRCTDAPMQLAAVFWAYEVCESDTSTSVCTLHIKRNRITGLLKRSYQKLICLLALIN